MVFEHLERVAAQGELIHQDDTSVRILTLIKENQEHSSRPAAQGLSRPRSVPGCSPRRWRCGWASATALYYSGRRHAGENLAALLDKREADLEKPLAMSDALSRNEVRWVC